MSDSLHLIPAEGDPIRARLDAARRNLLDTTLRNRLLNYRPSKRYGVEAAGERPADVIRTLVDLGRTMTFRGRPDPKGSVGDQDLFHLQSDELHDFGDAASLQALRRLAEEELDAYVAVPIPALEGDFVIDTAATATELQHRLTGTFRTMRQSIEEQGVNVLFLALGMLRWREAGGSGVERLAPLVLIPVELVQPRRGPYRLRHSGEEVGGNLPLAEKLKLDFGVRMPTFPDPTILDVEQYFSDVEAAIAEQPEWRVDRGAVVLSFFSFAKYLMFVDLDGALWSDGAKPWEHPVMRALLGDEGFPFEPPAIPDDANLDDLRPVSGSHEVVNADSSQLAAIMEASRGRSLVIQGPPGTGKSQTITNLVAEMVAEGKSVLFVAEKMAALDVVSNNLRRVGLHDLCLELHSHKAKKADFYAELARTLRLGRPETREAEEQRERLAEVRAKLNAYCEAVNAPVAPFGVTPHEAMGRLGVLPEPTEHALALPCEAMAGWDADRFRLGADLVRLMQAKIQADGLPADNPFFGARTRHVPPEAKVAVRSEAGRVAEALAALRAASDALGAALGLAPPAHGAGTRLLLGAGRLVLGAPGVTGVRLDADWSGQAHVVRSALDAARTVQAALGAFEGRLVPGAWAEDVAAERADLAASRGTLLRFFRGDYRRARRTLRALLAQPRVADDDLLAAADAVLAVQEARRVLAAASDAMATLFGQQWRGEQTDAAALGAILDWVLDVAGRIEADELPSECLRAWASRLPGPDLAPAVEAAEGASRAFEEAFTALLETLAADEELRALARAPYADIEARLGSWVADTEELARLAAFNLLAEEADGLQMRDTVAALERDPRAADEAADAFARRWYGGILAAAVRERPVIERFDRVAHEDSVGAYRRLDDVLLRLNRTRLAERHWESIALVGGWGHGEVAWLQHECAKKRAHKPIRVAMAEAGAAIRQIKPVFMMSPMSVALYLGPDGPKFDAVVFDEASQVKPEDAFGAIIRGGQAIVVGDSKQMPPTSFFDAVTQVVEDEFEEEEDVTRDLESILTLMESRIPPRSAQVRDLRWHYRSRHESLIAPSNALFYGSRLHIFPSPDGSGPDVGLKFHHLPDTVYGRGGSRKNPKEAVAVARAAWEHTRRCPERSLGLVAFSQAQAEAIEDALDVFRRQDDAIRAFEERHEHERLFVKNLETVQGDERDVIFVSVGYGKDADGRMSMNFGPLNQEGGERRLNVLVTRARWACEVFCNFRATDLRVGADAGEGMRAFHAYLHYAETGALDLDAPTDAPPMSPLEESVIQALRRAGHDVEAQVGVAGFFIDVGVRDPDRPGRFALGVECDGASYHSSRSARDRDKLRQTILEDRGWRIHRVWSTDWWMRRPTEERRLEEAVARAVALGPVEAASAPEGVETIERAEEGAPSGDAEAVSYAVCPLRIALGARELKDVPPDAMAPWIEEVLAVESPIHLDEIVRRLKTASGTPRATSAVRLAVAAGVAHLARAGRAVLDDPFVWRAPRHAVIPRDRSGLDAELRKIETICTAEIEAAVVGVVARALRIARSEVASPAMKRLGFDRVGDGIRRAVEAALDSLLADGTLLEESGMLRRR